jgi:hypothetical protein
MPATELTRLDRDRSQWDDAFCAFLAQKERRHPRSCRRAIVGSQAGRCAVRSGAATTVYEQRGVGSRPM